MKIILITLSLMLAIQFQQTLSGPVDRTQEISTLQQTKRFKLIELVYKNFRKSIWPEEIFPKINEYMNELQHWCDSDEDLKKSRNYQKLQEGISNCLSLVKELSKDPENCEKQWALRLHHEQLKTLFKSLEDEKLQGLWISKYAEFMLPLRGALKKSTEKFYATTSSNVESFIQSLNDVEKQEEVDILRWFEKFSDESDYIRKQILTIEFMGLFPDEREILEEKCKIQFSNRL